MRRFISAAIRVENKPQQLTFEFGLPDIIQFSNMGASPIYFTGKQTGFHQTFYTLFPGESLQVNKLFTLVKVRTKRGTTSYLSVAEGMYR